MTCSGVTGNKTLGRCFSLLPVHSRMTNIGNTLCIQPNTIPHNIDGMHSWVTPFIIVKVSLCYWKEVPQLLIGMPWVIVLYKNSLHCWFLQMRNLSLPDLFPVLPEQVTYAFECKTIRWLRTIMLLMSQPQLTVNPPLQSAQVMCRHMNFDLWSSWALRVMW